MFPFHSFMYESANNVFCSRTLHRDILFIRFVYICIRGFCILCRSYEWIELPPPSSSSILNCNCRCAKCSPTRSVGHRKWRTARTREEEREEIQSQRMKYKQSGIRETGSMKVLIQRVCVLKQVAKLFAPIISDKLEIWEEPASNENHQQYFGNLNFFDSQNQWTANANE